MHESTPPGDDAETSAGIVGDTINHIGVGKFQLLSCLLLGLGNAADAVELTSISFILPQLPNVSDEQKGVLSSGVFVGMLIGSLFSGVLSDRWGRKPTLVTTLAVNAMFGALSAVAPTWGWLVAFRILSGLGVGGSAGLVFTLLAEFLPTARRGFYLTIVAWFWMFGSIYSAGTAWMMLGLGVSWRWYALVSAAPAALGSLLILWKIPESPRLMFVQKEYALGISVLRDIARINDKLPELQPHLARIKRVVNRSINNSDINVENPSKTCLQQFQDSLRESLVSVLRLFVPSIRRSTICLTLVFWSLNYGWYGLTMWIPAIMDQLGNMNIYESTFLVVLANIPGNIISALIVDVVGRKHLLSGSMAIAGLVAFAFSFAQAINSAWYTIPIAMAFNCFGTMGWNALDVISAELFPTEVRNTGLGFVMAFGRLGSILSQIVNGFLINSSLPLMLGIIGVNILIGCASTLFLHEPAGMMLVDFIVKEVPFDSDPRLALTPACDLNPSHEEEDSDPSHEE